MITRDYEKLFRKSVWYKRVSIFIILVSVWPVSLEGTVWRFVGIILMIVGLLLSTQYKCPDCGARFDLRQSSHKITYCNECGTRLQD